MNTKYFTLCIIILTVISINCGLAQTFKKDTRSKIEKEDSNNTYNIESISTLDLMQILDIAGLKLNTFEIDPFDTIRQIEIYLDEYKNGVLINMDTIFSDNNQYNYYVADLDEFYFDYLDKIKVITKKSNQNIVLDLRTYKSRFSKILEIDKTCEHQFYEIRRYIPYKLSINEKVPLMIYGSSWKDKSCNIQRFCGARVLSKQSKETIELLDLSPHYYKLSIEISNVNQ